MLLPLERLIKASGFNEKGELEVNLRPHEHLRTCGPVRSAASVVTAASASAADGTQAVLSPLLLAPKEGPKRRRLVIDMRALNAALPTRAAKAERLADAGSQCRAPGRRGQPRPRAWPTPAANAEGGQHTFFNVHQDENEMCGFQMIVGGGRKLWLLHPADGPRTLRGAGRRHVAAAFPNIVPEPSCPAFLS